MVFQNGTNGSAARFNYHDPLTTTTANTTTDLDEDDDLILSLSLEDDADLDEDDEVRTWAAWGLSLKDVYQFPQIPSPNALSFLKDVSIITIFLLGHPPLDSQISSLFIFGFPSSSGTDVI